MSGWRRHPWLSALVALLMVFMVATASARAAAPMRTTSAVVLFEPETELKVPGVGVTLPIDRDVARRRPSRRSRRVAAPARGRRRLRPRACGPPLGARAPPTRS